MNAIVKGGEKPEDIKNVVNNVKTLYESRIKITKFFDIILEFYLKLNT